MWCGIDQVTFGEEHLRNEHVTARPALQVNRALWLYSSIVVSVTGASWLLYRLLGYAPIVRPLFRRADRFRDLTNYIGKTAHLRDGATILGRGLPVYNYPAPGAFVFKALIYAVPGHAARTHLAFLAVCVSAFAFVTWRASRVSNGCRLSAGVAILTTAALGYPLWFDADRGNIECVVWALAAVGLCFFAESRYRTAAVFIGLASCVKPFPAIFLLLLVRRRRYKEAALGVVVAGLMAVAALMVMEPNPLKAYRELKPGIALYTADYVMKLAPIEEAKFDHSLLDGMKSAAVIAEMGGIHPLKIGSEVIRLSAEPSGWHVVHTLVRVYAFVVVLGLGLLLAIFYRMPILNQLTALAVALTIFSPSSGDYTLLHLYVPFGALLVFLTREVAKGRAALRSDSMFTFVVIYGLLFSPSTLLMTYAGDAKLILLLALLVVAARSPMHSAYFDEEPLGVTG
jgi:Glycosyltransferase family 87